jgi:hypothetical protein
MSPSWPIQAQLVAEGTFHTAVWFRKGVVGPMLDI